MSTLDGVASCDMSDARKKLMRALIDATSAAPPEPDVGSSTLHCTETRGSHDAALGRLGHWRRPAPCSLLAAIYLEPLNLCPATLQSLPSSLHTLCGRCSLSTWSRESNPGMEHGTEWLKWRRLLIPLRSYPFSTLPGTPLCPHSHSCRPLLNTCYP